MADNRYRPRSPPSSRRYHDPRASTGMVIPPSFDPSYSSQPRSAIEPYHSSRHGSIYDTRPIKQYSYKDDAYPGGTVSRTEYAVRPRTNSAIPSESRRPLSMVVKNTSPTRRPVISNSSRDDTRSPLPAPYSARDEPSRYLVPSASHGREYHQRPYSATRADADRLNVGSRAGGRARGEYHQAGGYSQKPYANNRSSVKDDDYSYTGPREQFVRDMQSRPPPPRDTYARRERPMSVVEIPEFKAPTTARRDLGPPPASRQFDRLERPDDRRLSTHPVYEEPERASDFPQRRQSVRAPVVHQLRDENYPPSRDDADFRPPPKPRRERVEEDEPLPKLRTRDLDREYGRDRDYARDLDRERDRELRDRERDRDRDWDRERDRERVRQYERTKHSDDRREARSRENSPERSSISKGVATGLGGAAVAGLAGAAIKSSLKPEEASDSDGHKERRHRKHKHRDRLDEEPDARDVEPSDRRAPAPVDDRGHDDRLHAAARRDESASESYEDEHQRRRHRRRKHRDRDEEDLGAGGEVRATGEPSRPDRDVVDPEDDGRPRRRHDRAASRNREPEPAELERRTISPGEDEDDRPRRVQLVEPEKKEDFRPKGILKPPRAVPFPEDPNPTREGVAPLKDAGKDGIPTGARWTKISRVLVNPEALEKAHERFEERDDYVIVLRVVSREEIQKFAEKTREIREAREKQWQEELEKQRHSDPEHRTPYESDRRRREDEARSGDDDDAEGPRPLLDQKPAVPGIDPRDLIKAAGAAPAPGGLPVPDIKLESHDVEAANYSTNV